jgi:UDPglucose 6-dehydrogenase
MMRIAEEAGYDFAFLRGVIAVNDEQFERVADKVVEVAGGSLEGVVVGALGLTFKANTDDLRESPALEIIRRLLQRGARVRAYDPAVRVAPVEGIHLADDAYGACENASVAVVLTEWDEFKWLDLDKLAATMAELNVVDARNVLDRGALQRRGFTYRGIGRH